MTIHAVHDPVLQGIEGLLIDHIIRILKNLNISRFKVCKLYPWNGLPVGS
jgi:hypothetical protein